MLRAFAFALLLAACPPPQTAPLGARDVNVDSLVSPVQVGLSWRPVDGRRSRLTLVLVNANGKRQSIEVGRYPRVTKQPEEAVQPDAEGGSVLYAIDPGYYVGLDRYYLVERDGDGLLVRARSDEKQPWDDVVRVYFAPRTETLPLVIK